MKRNASKWYIDNLQGKSGPNLMAKLSNRFYNDKVIHEDNKEILLLDGIILNKNELLKEHHVEDLKLFLKLVFKDISIASKIIGVFTIFLYDKINHKGVALGNQTGDTSVFYTIKDGRIVAISNDFNCLTTKSTNNELDERAAHYLLTYGFMIDDHTIVKNTKKVGPGEFLSFSIDGEFRIEKYHRLDFSKKINVSIDKAAEQFNFLFRKAVKRCFDKDLEYGYNNHLADLSAGLDSRMVNWVAKDLGYDNVINISYSQRGSDEEKITNKVATKLGNKFFFRPLDGAAFLYDIDRIVEEEYGLAYYCGITGGWDFLNLIDFDSYGLEHTGQIGDAVLSSIVSNGSSPIIEQNTKRNSSLINLRFDSFTDEFYNTQEEFVYYTRVFRGALSTHYIRKNYTYAVSPFLDLDVLEFCSKLPDSMRENHKLYWYWIDHYYPDAAKLKSSRLRTDNFPDKIRSYYRRGTSKINRTCLSILYAIGLRQNNATSNNMNPYTYWYNTNPNIRNFIRKQYETNVHLISAYPKLVEEVTTMIESPNALDKLMAISMLATVKRYCNG